MGCRDELITLPMDYQHWTLCFLYTLDIVEVLAQEEGQEAACDLSGGLLDRCVRTHEDEGTWLVLTCEQTGWATTHRSSEHNHILAVESEASLVDWRDSVDEDRASTLLDSLWRRGEPPPRISLTFQDLVLEEAVPWVFHGQDRAVEGLL